MSMSTPMPIIAPMLHHIRYTQLDCQSWCITAQIVTEQPYLKHKHKHKREQQRSGVRQLLQFLLDELGIDDILNDAQFPYQLSNSGYYVCFSHSGDKVAVALSKYRAIGIDIEVQDIPWHVAERFYDDNEVDALAQLTNHEHASVSRLLWQIKESFIKIHQYKLAQGLGKDYSYLIPDLTNNTQTESLLTIIADCQTDYHLAVLPPQQTVVIF